MQGTRVQCLVWEDPTYLREIQPGHHNYWASALKPKNYNYWNYWGAPPNPHNYWRRSALEPMLHNKTNHRSTAMRRKPTAPTLPHLLQLEKAAVQQGRPSTAKNKQTKPI